MINVSGAVFIVVSMMLPHPPPQQIQIKIMVDLALAENDLLLCSILLVHTCFLVYSFLSQCSFFSVLHTLTLYWSTFFLFFHRYILVSCGCERQHSNCQLQ